MTASNVNLFALAAALWEVSCKPSPGPKVRCLACQEVIQSQHRHDYQPCGCGSTAVDGGGEYLRVNGDAWELVEDCGEGSDG